MPTPFLTELAILLAAEPILPNNPPRFGFDFATTGARRRPAPLVATSTDCLGLAVRDFDREGTRRLAVEPTLETTLEAAFLTVLTVLFTTLVTVLLTLEAAFLNRPNRLGLGFVFIF